MRGGKVRCQEPSAGAAVRRSLAGATSSSEPLAYLDDAKDLRRVNQLSDQLLQRGQLLRLRAVWLVDSAEILYGGRAANE